MTHCGQHPCCPQCFDNPRAAHPGPAAPRVVNIPTGATAAFGGGLALNFNNSHKARRSRAQIAPKRCRSVPSGPSPIVRSVNDERVHGTGGGPRRLARPVALCPNSAVRLGANRASRATIAFLESDPAPRRSRDRIGDEASGRVYPGIKPLPLGVRQAHEVAGGRPV